MRRNLVVAGVAGLLAVLAIAPARATAATAQVVEATRGDHVFLRVLFAADPGETNHLVVSEPSDDLVDGDRDRVQFRDLRGAVITPGPGCAQTEGGGVSCVAPYAEELEILLEDADDTLTFDLNADASPLAIAVFAGTGDDRIDADDAGAVAQVLVRGGDGHDDVSAAASTRLEIYGEEGADKLTGTGGAANLWGPQGVLYGGPDDDTLTGVYTDDLFGGSGDDLLRHAGDMHGEDGDDRLLGDPAAVFGGPDMWSGRQVTGGAGADLLVGGAAEERFDGGAGDDRLLTLDTTGEQADCGDGADQWVGDPADAATGCEKP